MIKWPWIPFFKAGTHTDSKGREFSYSETDLDSIAQNYDEKKHTAPVVIGHPKSNLPAYGWVKNLKRIGNVLYAELSDYRDEFKEIVQSGLYKKVSASFYEDGSLRHIGFLGAQPPAIKGLPQIEFSDSDNFVEFTETEINGWALSEKFVTLKGILRRLREWIIEKEGVDTADRISGNYDIDRLDESLVIKEKEHSYEEGIINDTGGNKMDELTKLKSENDDLKNKVTDFSEKMKALETEVNTLKAEKAEAAETAVRKEYREFCENLVKEGKIAPVEVAAHVETMHALGKQGVVEFAENGEKKQHNPLEFYKNNLSALPKTIEFGEVASAGKPVEAGKAGELAELANKGR
ncbi:MAG: hypothetical protein ACOX2F_07260 [bacterium]